MIGPKVPLKIVNKFLLWYQSFYCRINANPPAIHTASSHVKYYHLVG